MEAIMSIPALRLKGILAFARSGAILAVLGMALLLGCGGKSGTAAPVIGDFTAWPATITAGQGTFLTFAFTGDHGGSIDQGVGTVTSGGSLMVAPTATTTYTLTANNGGVVRTSTVTVTVKTYAPKFVYVACAGSNGGLYGFALNDATGALTPIPHSSPETLTPGFHVAGDPQGRFLFVVNGDGTPGSSKLAVYRIDATTGALTPVSPIVTTASDPWCTAVDPSGKYVYVRCGSSISAYSLDGATGVLTSLGAAIPTSADRGDIIVHPSGRYLFTAGKASNSVDVFEINAASGALTRKGAPYLLPTGTGPAAVAVNSTGEFLYTKGEGAPGAQVSNAIYGYRLGFDTGLLTPLGSGALVSGLLAEDAYHGLFASPNQNVLYGAFGNASPIMDMAAYNLNPATGTLTQGPTSPYAWFAGNASDCITVTRNGKWAFVTNYYGSQLATASVDPLTGALTRINPTSGTVGNFPVSVAVVGVLQ
jgi:6-phosphogluconolactonase (cycloisomerase 2 family)